MNTESSHVSSPNAHEGEEVSTSPGARSKTTLFVPGLASETTSKDLAEVFSGFEGFLSSKIIFEKDYAFVEFASPNDARHVHDKFKSRNLCIELNGKKLLVFMALPTIEWKQKKKEREERRFVEKVAEKVPVETQADFHERALKLAGPDFAVLAARVQKDLDNHFPHETEVDKATRLTKSTVKCIHRLLDRIEEYVGTSLFSKSMYGCPSLPLTLLIQAKDIHGTRDETKAQQRMVLFGSLISIRDNLNLIDKMNKIFPDLYPAIEAGLQKCRGELRNVGKALNYTETPFNQMIDFSPVQDFLHDGIYRFQREFVEFEETWGKNLAEAKVGEEEALMEWQKAMEEL